MTPKPSERLGAYFRSRREKGKAGLPTMSVTLDRGLVLRDSIDRKMETNLSPDEHLRVYPGDIAYNMMRMWQGASGIAEADGIVSPAYVVLAPNPNVDPLFASYLFKTSEMIHRFWAFSYGLTDDRLRLYPRDFTLIPASLPPLPEQQKIAEILGTWDKAIETTEALLANARAQKRALMQSLLTGTRRYPGFEDHQWREVRLGELGKCIRGVSYKPDQTLPEETPSSFRLYRATNIQMGEIVESDLVFIPAELVTRERILREGDLAVCMSNGSKHLVGKSAPFRATDEKHTVGAFCAIFRSHDRQQADFVRFLFQSPSFDDHISTALAGSSINNLKNSDIEEMSFRVPSSLEEAQKITHTLLTVEAEVNRLFGMLDHLRTEKRSLMQQLLTGKRRVVV